MVWSFITPRNTNTQKTCVVNALADGNWLQVNCVQVYIRMPQISFIEAIKPLNGKNKASREKLRALMLKSCFKCVIHLTNLNFRKICFKAGIVNVYVRNYSGIGQMEQNGLNLNSTTGFSQPYTAQGCVQQHEPQTRDLSIVIGAAGPGALSSEVGCYSKEESAGDQRGAYPALNPDSALFLSLAATRHIRLRRRAQSECSRRPP